jgi:hypothetical protein
MMRLIILLGIFILVLSCNKDEVEPSAPIVETVGVTDITDSSLKVGGRITSDGGHVITSSGFCWSTITTGPTLADDTIVVNAVGGAFVTEMERLDPSSTYYVRAYAVNELGVGYGSVFTVNTLNAVPVVSKVMIQGVAIIDSVLTGSYVYSDFENDPDSGTVFQWYSAADTVSGSDIPISGADSAMYTVSISDTLRFIRLAVTPLASAGSSPGSTVKSNWLGPVPK